ncbi:MAG TPA: DUF2852 domain-containing protein [Acetobacteraceae bacterium]|nr:DUF2852 domain-containing protein [Acetobacteraceae bacterium]
MSATNNEAYGNAAWGSGPAGGPWGPPPWAGQGWHDRPHWARDIPRPVWIGFMILGFIFWWPVGLAMLVYLLASGRMSCGPRARHWANQQGGYQAGPGAGWGGWARWCGGDRAPPSSGNRAFDDYRAETLRRLEEEQREFGAFLDRLRVAKDKAEFDQFMAERRGRPPQPQDGPQPPVQ